MRDSTYELRRSGERKRKKEMTARLRTGACRQVREWRILVGDDAKRKKKKAGSSTTTPSLKEEGGKKGIYPLTRRGKKDWENRPALLVQESAALGKWKKEKIP